MTEATLPISREEMIARLLETDQRAVEGVNAGLGGPFGSSVVVYYPNQSTGTMERYTLSMEHNRVISTGYSGAHAENNALIGAREELVKFLRTHPDSIVVMYSSAESCCECRSKEETMARYLQNEGLIKPGNFYVVYGATFQDTAEIARFNDAPYLEDIKKPEGQRLITVDTMSSAEAIQLDRHGKVARALANFQRHVALVIDPESQAVFGYGIDQTNERGILATAVSGAIRDAGKGRMLAGKEMPWNLGGATLLVTYGAKSGIGPRTYATAQWANINRVVLINDLDPLPGGNSQHQEAHGISNRELFDVIQGPYDHPMAAVRTIHLDEVREQLRAQRQWRHLLDTGKIPAAAVYNGIKVASR